MLGSQRNTYMPAGDNEKLFKELITSKFGNDCLRGKENFKLELDGYQKVSISVDESMSIGDETILIEIDSGNMAKLIAGQYALLNVNGMYTGQKANTLFLVIHYYRDKKTDKVYSPERTLANLNAIQHFNSDDTWIPFNAFNIEGFETILHESLTLDDLKNKIWPNNANSRGRQKA